MIRGLILAVALAFPAAAAAQFRSIPAEAKRGEIRHVGQMDVEINGKKMRLSAGSQIRDANNRVVVPMALPAGARVKFLLDAQEMVHRVWILTPQEAAQPDPKR
jgi:hypothetical protein